MCVVRLFGVMDVRTRNIHVCSAFASAHFVTLIQS